MILQSLILEPEMNRLESKQPSFREEYSINPWNPETHLNNKQD